MSILQGTGDTVTSLKLAFQRHHTSLEASAVGVVLSIFNK